MLEAEAVEKFFVARHWGQQRPPRYISTWAATAKELKGFDKLLMDLTTRMRFDVSDDGALISKAMKSPAMWEGDSPEVWKWMKKLPDWRKEARPGSLEAFEERLNTWCSKQMDLQLNQ